MFRLNDIGHGCMITCGHSGLGSLYSPVALVAHDGGRYNPHARHVAFWLKPLSILGLYILHDVYREFACANRATDPGPSPPDAGRYTVASRF